MLGRKAMTNLDSILKSWHNKRDITLPTKIHLVKAMIFPAVMYGYESWTIKKGWTPKDWCFWTAVLEKTLESSLACKEIQPVNPKGNQSWIFVGRIDAEAEALLWQPDVKSWLIRKDPEAEKDWRQEDDRGCWMASPTWWTWVLASSGRWLRTEKPGILQSTRSQSVRHNWATDQQ